MNPSFSHLVAIAMPSGDMVHADFTANLAALCLNPGAPAAIVSAKGSIIAINRNQCVSAAQAIGASHILFLDTDLVFPLDLLTRLLRHDKDIVGALYAKRTPPFHALGVTEDGKRLVLSGGLQRMKIMPAGCLMIRLSAFDKLPRPWFCDRHEGEKIMGEDYHFCEQAHIAGFEIWCDTALSREIGHIGQKVFRLGETEAV